MANSEITVDIVDTNWFLGQDPPEGTVLFKEEMVGILALFHTDKTSPKEKQQLFI